MRARRPLRLAAAAIAALTAFAEVAAAQEDVCMSIEAQLAALDMRINDGFDGGTAAIDQEIETERAALDDAVQRLRDAGRVGVFGGSRPGADCRSLTARVGRARANLARLNSQRRQAAPSPFALQEERGDLLRAFAANGCSRGGTVISGGGGSRFGHGTFETVLGNGRLRTIWGPEDYGPTDFAYGTFRTLCVRTCDGYYFPVSFATTAERFATDEQACSALCPGTPTALYVHRNPGGNIEQAVSLAGEPYRSLATAFRYRQSFDSACRCGAVVASAAPTAEPPALTDISPPQPALRFAMPPAPDAPAPPPAIPPDATYGGILPAPEARVAAAEDPETLANRAGGIGARPPPSDGTVANDGGRVEVGADGRAIRVVGPSFYVPTESRPIPVKPPPASPDER